MQFVDEKSREIMASYTPDNPIYHSSGYTLNMPLGLQGYPGWERDRPELLQSLYAERDSLGIVVEDDLFQEPVEDEEEDMKSVFDGLDEE